MDMQDPNVREVVRKAIGEMSAAMTRVEAERDLMKEIAKKLNEDHNISKKAFNKLARVYHKQTFAKESEEFEEFETMYETVLS
jgi:hypothetical protein